MKFRNDDDFEEDEIRRNDDMIENAREQMEYQRDEEIWNDILDDFDQCYPDDDFF